MPTPEMEGCICDSADMSIRYRAQTGKHYLYVNPEKMKLWEKCPTYPACMFLRYNELFRQLIEFMDEGKDTRPRIG